MDDLTDKLKIAFATSYAFYLKAANFHWNVEGMLFNNFHQFFGNLYEEVQGSLDATAEQIRTLNAYTPSTFKRLEELSVIGGEERVGLDPKEMVALLANDNKKVSKTLMDAFEAATTVNKQGLADYISGRLDAHKKHQWMLDAHLKG